MFRRKVVKGQQGIAILGQAFDRLGVLGPVSLHEEIKGLVGMLTRVGLPDIMQLILGSRLQPFGQFVQDIGRLMHGTPLLAGVR